MDVLVTGATGYVGSRLVAALLDADGEAPRVVTASRNIDNLRRFDWFDDVDAVRLDTTDSASCVAAFAEIGPIDVAYYLVHAIGEANYRERDQRSAAAFAEAAAAAGVGRVVYLGGFVPDDDDLSPHLASRAEVGEALTCDGLDTVWLRSAIVLGAGSTSFELVRYVADRLPALPLPSWMNKPVQPIAVDDLLYYLLAAQHVAPGRYDVGGDEAVAYRDVLFSYIHAAGMRRLGVPAPTVPTALAGFIIGSLMPASVGLTSSLITSLNNTMTMGDKPIRDVIPDPPGGFTTIDDAMARCLRGIGERPVGVRALEDPLQLADTDAPWTGGDVLSIRRRVEALLSEEVWGAMESLGARRILGSWPISGGLRTGLDLAFRLRGTP
ncbi:NAD-dependent epimerase/dehydratase family protein [Antrihabitans cavernicola]|uniref:NAD-dependent epimerase/dehydratase family protein n=1 Tax=Antrihabitans cavernicola TaxID=2495913 RepID=A0A5A7S9P5_9NOCA|nr:NAD-dependent epimerase/dehydratase family protein [Spelaeibacter cavernicola]KAA0022204.1 NAD-dependent epimerase/dehydratase family protein [Spelaeibacter cavernicola]